MCPCKWRKPLRKDSRPMKASSITAGSCKNLVTLQSALLVTSENKHLDSSSAKFAKSRRPRGSTLQYATYFVQHLRAEALFQPKWCVILRRYNRREKWHARKSGRKPCLAVAVNLYKWRTPSALLVAACSVEWYFERTGVKSPQWEYKSCLPWLAAMDPSASARENSLVILQTAIFLKPSRLTAPYRQSHKW